MRARRAAEPTANHTFVRVLRAEVSNKGIKPNRGAIPSITCPLDVNTCTRPLMHRLFFGRNPCEKHICGLCGCDGATVNQNCAWQPAQSDGRINTALRGRALRTISCSQVSTRQPRTFLGIRHDILSQMVARHDRTLPLAHLACVHQHTRLPAVLSLRALGLAFFSRRVVGWWYSVDISSIVAGCCDSTRS